MRDLHHTEKVGGGKIREIREYTFVGKEGREGGSEERVGKYGQVFVSK